MSNSQLESFLKDLRDSAVIPESDLQPFLAGRSESDPKELALAIVQAGLLTDWQAKFILSGRSRLRVGNYLLLERLRRDGLGDCFLARHEPLRRQVRLQILPEAVTRQAPEFQAVTNLVGQLTALDDPRLEHVFDLGEEGGRLFVVFEESAGRRLDARSLATLTQGEAAGLLQGISAALAVLQARRLPHGEVAAAGLLLEPSGAGKLVGLCESSLRRALNADPPIPQSDWLRLDRREWRELAERLLARHFRAPEFDAWRKLADDLLEQPQSLNELAKGVETWRRDVLGSSPGSDLGLEPAEQPQAQSPPELSASGPASPADAHQNKPAATATRQQPQRSAGPGKSPKAAERRSWLQLYSLAVALTAVAGLIAFLLWKFLPGVAPSATAAKLDDRDQLIQSTAIGSGKGGSPRDLDESPRRKVRQQPSEQPGERPAAKSSEPALQEPVTETVEGGEKSEGGSAEFEKRIPGSGLETPLVLAEATPQARPNAQRQEKDPFQIPAKKSGLNAAGPAGSPAAADSLQLQPPGSGEPQPGPTNPPRAPGQPFIAGLAGFPPAVELGSPGEQERQLGPLPNLMADQVSLQLLYDPETVARSRILFELQALPEQSTWAVVSRKKAGDPEVQPVGEFRIAEGNLRFRWAEGLDSKSKSLALRNCWLQIGVASGIGVVIALREPLLIEGFEFDEKTLRAEAKFDLPASPNSDNLAVAIGPFPREGAWAEAVVLNQDFEGRQPAVVVFRPVPNEQLFGVAVNRSWRGQVELNANWVVQLPELPNKPIPNWQACRQSDLQKLVEYKAQEYTRSVGVADAATRAAEDAPFGSKEKMRDRATEAKNEMQRLKLEHELIGVLPEKLAAIRSSGIPLRLIYRGGERELVLAETPAVREALAAIEAERTQPPQKNQRGNARGMK